MLAHVIELHSEAATAIVLPEIGGRVGRLAVDGTDVLVTGDATDSPMLWGSFPMAPWAGRVRHGRFVHEGATHELPLTLPPHAGHGTVWEGSWTRTDDGADPATAALTCPLGPDWPLSGHADQHFQLTTSGLRCTLAVTAGDRSMPAEVGWHPWFRTTGPLDWAPTAMYERGADHLPTGRLVDPGPSPWDDCFVNTAPVRFPVGPLTVTVQSDCDHLVVFDEMDIGIAVEPQSGPPDAFRLGPHLLGSGERLQRTMSISWSPGDP
jgi:aldose 1-epimerase